MGLRFRKSIKIAPGVRLNIGKKSTGISIGGKYGGISMNSKTGMRARVSAPGTGLSYSTKIGGKSSSAKKTKPISNTAVKRTDSNNIVEDIPTKSNKHRNGPIAQFMARLSKRDRWIIGILIFFLISASTNWPEPLGTNVSNALTVLLLAFLIASFVHKPSSTPIERTLSKMQPEPQPEVNYTAENLNNNLSNDIVESHASAHESLLSHSKPDYSIMLDDLPHVSIGISDEKAPKRSVGEISELNYSNITKRTPRDKLGNFVAIDTETTGLNVTNSEIVEIAAIRFRGFEPVECFSTLCKPRKGISEESSKINGITEDMVADKPEFGFIVQALQDFIGEDNLVGHNLPFDLKFIVKYGVDLTKSSKRKYYDTLRISQHTLKKIKEKWDNEFMDYMPDYDGDYDVIDYKLETLCFYYGIPLSTAHRALDDCYATGLLLEKLAIDRE